MRILVIGGSGFIGRPLARKLRASGHELALFQRNQLPDESSAGTVQILGDRDRLSEYRGQFQQFAPDVVIDVVLSSGGQARQLMQTVSGIAGRVVALSSMDVYRAWGVLHGVEPGPLEPLPLTEASPVRSARQLYPSEALKMMRSVFSWLDEHYDKIAVEEEVMNYSGVSGTVLRLPMVYGPGDRLHRFFPLLKRIADGRSAVVMPDDFAAWRGPRGYVENVAHAIALAATSEKAAGRIYNVCEEPAWSELEWQKAIANQTSWPGKFVVLPKERVPRHLWFPGNAAQHVVAASQCIRSDLGYREVVGQEEAIRRTIASERKNPPAGFDPQQFDYAAEDQALDEAAETA